MKLRSVAELAPTPIRSVRIHSCLLCLCLCLAQAAYAFEYPVPPDDVRQAYYLGQTSDHEKLAAFYKPYIHRFPYPAGNPLDYVELVEFRTPYEQIVQRSQMHLNVYTPFDADRDYQANPGLVIVRVVILYKAGYEYVGPGPSLEGFKFFVSQNKAIEPQEAPTASVCNPYWGGVPCVNLEIDATLHFRAEQFAQQITTIKVETPEGKTFQTNFNLAKLK